MKIPRRIRLFRPVWACLLLAVSACTQSDVIMVDASRVEVTPAEAGVILGQQTQLTATVLASGGEPLSGRTVTWVSDDPDVATADASGRVIGVGLGTAVIRATSEGATGTARVTVTAGPVPILSVNPEAISFAAVQNGATPGERTASVTNAGTGQLGALAVAVRYPTGAAGGWLSAVLGSSSAPATITLSANQAGLAPGTYTAFVDVSATGAQNSPVAVRVELTVAGPQPAIGLGATAVSFAAPAGGANPTKQSVAVTNAGGGTLSGLAAAVNYTAGQPTGWLAAALGSTTAPTTLELTAVTGALPVGVYTATVRVSSAMAQNSPQDVQVTFTVGSPPPAIGVNPSSLTFTAVTGTAAATQQVAITNPGSGSLTGLGIAVTYPGGQPSGWVTTSLAGTTAPTTLTAGANAAGLAAGTYTASISITSPVASNSPTSVNVTFHVIALPTAPTGLSATALGPTRVDLAWTDNSTDETGFQLERNANGGVWTSLASLPANATSFSDVTASPATTHSYRVRACRGTACSAFSAVASATTPDPVPGVPSNLVAATISPTRIGVTWDAPTTGGPVVGYRIERRAGTGAFALVDSVGAGTRSLQDSGLQPGTTYGYRVQACNASGCSAFSAVATATTGAQPPVAEAGGPYSGVVGSNVTLDGSGSSDPDGTIASYRWVIADAGEPTVLTGVSPAYPCTAAGAFSVTLTVTDNSGATGSDGTTLTCTAAPAPKAPSGLSATAVGATRVDLAWTDNSSDETGFRVERSVNGGGWTLLTSPAANTTSFSDTGVNSATTYGYRVQACNAAGCSAFSNEASATTPAQPPVADAGGPYSAEVGSNVTLDGSGSSDDGTIVSYRWEIADDGEPTVLTGVSPAYPCTTAGTFAVTLTVTDNSGATASDGTTLTCTAAPAPNPPSGLSATAVSATRVNLAWTDNSSDETGFRLERSVNDGSWSLLASLATSTTSFSDTTASPGTTYRYRVQACNAAGCSAFTSVATATTPSISTPGAPTGITFTDVGARSLTVNWSAPVTGGAPDRYFVERRGPTGPRTDISGDLLAGTFSFADSGLSPSTPYKYRVSACNAAGCTASADVDVTTSPGG